MLQNCCIWLRDDVPFCYCYCCHGPKSSESCENERRWRRFVTSTAKDKDQLNYAEVNFSAAGERLTTTFCWRQRGVAIGFGFGVLASASSEGKDSAHTKGHATQDTPPLGALAGVWQQHPQVTSAKRAEREKASSVCRGAFLNALATAKYVNLNMSNLKSTW